MAPHRWLCVAPGAVPCWAKEGASASRQLRLLPWWTSRSEPKAPRGDDALVRQRVSTNNKTARRQHNWWPHRWGLLRGGMNSYNNPLYTRWTRLRWFLIIPRTFCMAAMRTSIRFVGRSESRCGINSGVKWWMSTRRCSCCSCLLIPDGSPRLCSAVDESDTSGVVSWGTDNDNWTLLAKICLPSLYSKERQWTVFKVLTMIKRAQRLRRECRAGNGQR